MRSEACHDLLVPLPGFGRDANPARGDIEESANEERQAAVIRVGDLRAPCTGTPLLEPAIARSKSALPQAAKARACRL